MPPRLSKFTTRDASSNSHNAVSLKNETVSFLYILNVLVEEEIVENERDTCLFSLILSRHGNQSISMSPEICIEKISNFKSNIFTSDEFALFPFDEQGEDKWFKMKFERSNNKGEITNHEIKIINTSSKKKAIDRIKEEINYENEDQSKEFYFHGTSHMFAKNILEHGIDLSKGGENCDLSHKHGFYMANNFTYSLEHFSCFPKKKAPAILIFHLSSENLKNFKECNLCGKNNETTLNEFIKYNKSSQDNKLRKKLSTDTTKLIGDLRKYDHIKSPIKNDGIYGKDIKSLQICINSKKMAEDISIGPLLVAAIFIKPN